MVPLFAALNISPYLGFLNQKPTKSSCIDILTGLSTSLRITEAIIRTRPPIMHSPMRTEGDMTMPAPMRMPATLRTKGDMNRIPPMIAHTSNMSCGLWQELQIGTLTEYVVIFFDINGWLENEASKLRSGYGSKHLQQYWGKLSVYCLMNNWCLSIVTSNIHPQICTFKFLFKNRSLASAPGLTNGGKIV